MDSGKIVIKNSNGEKVECDILFTFDSEVNKKSYIVYTDNTFDELGNTKVYANTFDSDSDTGTLGEVETDEEWSLIEQIFSSINGEKEGK